MTSERTDNRRASFAVLLLAVAVCGAWLCFWTLWRDTAPPSPPSNVRVLEP